MIMSHATIYLRSFLKENDVCVSSDGRASTGFQQRVGPLCSSDCNGPLRVFNSELALALYASDSSSLELASGRRFVCLLSFASRHLPDQTGARTDTQAQP